MEQFQALSDQPSSPSLTLVQCLRSWRWCNAFRSGLWSQKPMAWIRKGHAPGCVCDWKCNSGQGLGGRGRQEQMCLHEQERMTLWSECKTSQLHWLLGFGTGCCTSPEQATCLCCLFRWGLGLLAEGPLSQVLSATEGSLCIQCLANTMEWRLQPWLTWPEHSPHWKKEMAAWSRSLLRRS